MNTEPQELRNEDAPEVDEEATDTTAPAESTSGARRTRRDEPAADDEFTARTFTVTPGCVFAGLSVAFLCVVVAGAGLLLSGTIDGIGPLRAGTSGAGVPSVGQMPASTVAVVNGQPITTDDLDHLVAINLAMSSLQSSEPLTFTPEQRLQARSEMLNQAIRNTLLLQAAESAGITVTDDQVEAEWLGWVRQSGLTPDQLDAELQRFGSNREGFQAWLHDALIANVYLNQYVTQGVDPDQRSQAYEQWIQQQMQTAQIQIVQQLGTAGGTN